MATEETVIADAVKVQRADGSVVDPATTQDIETNVGRPSDAEAATGDASSISLLKRLRTILSDVWQDAKNRLLVGLTDAGGSEINPAREDGNLLAAKNSLDALDDIVESDRAKVNPIVGQVGVDGGAGAATAKTLRSQLADDSISALRGVSAKTLTDIWSTLQDQREISESLWTDDAGGYYLRRVVIDESVNPPTFTVTWTDEDGASSPGPGAGARPVSTLDRELIEQRFIATADGTGYSTGDYLARALVVDTSQSPPIIDAAIWVNISTGSSISTPTAGTFEESGETVGVKGKDGTSIHGAANPLATEDQVAKDWDESGRAKTNPIVGQAGVAADAGASSALTQRVVTATDDANFASLKVVGGGAEAAAQRVTLSTESLAALELVGVKGRDGAAIASEANALPTSPVNLTYGTPSQVTVTSTAGNLVGATAGYRRVIVKVDGAAVIGIYVNPNGTATASHFLLGPGEVMTLHTNQAISALRAGASNVLVYIQVAT